jgi:hypothetical protein
VPEWLWSECGGEYVCCRRDFLFLQFPGVIVMVVGCRPGASRTGAKMADGTAGCGCTGRTLLGSIPRRVDSAGTVSNEGRARGVLRAAQLQDRACSGRGLVWCYRRLWKRSRSSRLCPAGAAAAVIGIRLRAKPLCDNRVDVVGLSSVGRADETIRRVADQ